MQAVGTTLQKHNRGFGQSSMKSNVLLVKIKYKYETVWKREEKEMFQEIISQMKTSADLLRHTQTKSKSITVSGHIMVIKCLIHQFINCLMNLVI